MNTQSGQVKRMVLWLNVWGFIQDRPGLVYWTTERFVHSVTSIIEQTFEMKYMKQPVVGPQGAEPIFMSSVLTSVMVMVKKRFTSWDIADIEKAVHFVLKSNEYFHFNDLFEFETLTISRKIYGKESFWAVHHAWIPMPLSAFSRDEGIESNHCRTHSVTDAVTGTF
jgi:hypothetical protein